MKEPLVLNESFNRTFYTTGQIAKLCQVAPRTVSKWIDSGRLKGMRIPGSDDRRVYHADLVEFMELFDFPIELIPHDDGRGALRVLVVGASSHPAFAAPHVAPAFAPTLFEAGALFATTRPRVVVVDLAVGRIESGIVLRQTSLCKKPCVALVDSFSDWCDSFAGWVTPSLEPAEMASQLRALVENGRGGSK